MVSPCPEMLNVYNHINAQPPNPLSYISVRVHFGSCSGLFIYFPRWSSGYPPMLLVLVLELESRRGEIVSLFAKGKKQLLKAPTVAWVGTIRQGKKELKSSRDKKARHEP